LTVREKLEEACLRLSCPGIWAWKRGMHVCSQPLPIILGTGVGEKCAKKDPPKKKKERKKGKKVGIMATRTEKKRGGVKDHSSKALSELHEEREKKGGTTSQNGEKKRGKARQDIPPRKERKGELWERKEGTRTRGDTSRKKENHRRVDGPGSEEHGKEKDVINHDPTDRGKKKKSAGIPAWTGKRTSI